MAKISDLVISAGVSVIIIGLMLYLMGFFAVAQTSHYFYATTNETLLDANFGTFNSSFTNSSIDTGVFLRLQNSASATGNYTMGNSTVILLSDIHPDITKIPNSTWTFHWYAYCNVTGKVKLYANITIVNPAGIFVDWVEEFAGLTTSLTTGNQTLTSTQSILEVDVDSTDYLKVTWFIEKSDSTSTDTKILLNSDGLGNFTRVGTVYTFEVLDAGTQLLIEAVATVLMVTVILVSVMSIAKIAKKKSD